MNYELTELFFLAPVYHFYPCRTQNLVLCKRSSTALEIPRNRNFLLYKKIVWLLGGFRFKPLNASCSMTVLATGCSLAS